MSKSRPDRVRSVGLNFGLTNKSSSKLVILKKIKKYLKFMFDPFRPEKVQKPIFLTQTDPILTIPIASPGVHYASELSKFKDGIFSTKSY